MTNELAIRGETQVATLEQYAANLQAKMQVVTILLKSNLIPQAFKSPEAALTAILYGQEIGFSPMQALTSVTVIQGKPTLDAAGIKAKIIEAGGRAETITWNDKICKLRGIRGDWKEEVEFTIGDADKMGLLAKDNWKRMPKAMLYARCVSVIGKNMFADVLKGFECKEAMLDVVSTEPTEPVNVTPEATQEKVDTGPHWYAVKNVAPAARKKAMEYATAEGAELIDAKLLIYRSEKALKKLISYEIEEPQIAPTADPAVDEIAEDRAAEVEEATQE